MIIVIGAVFGSTNKKENVVDNNSNTSQVVNHYYNLNESFVMGDLEYTFKSYEFKSYFYNNISYDTHYPSNDNNCFLVIHLNLVNKTSKRVSLVESGFLTSNHKYTYTIYYDDSVKYNSVYNNSRKYLLALDSVNPLETKSDIVLIYEVPNLIETSQEKLELKMAINSVKANEFFILKLREKTL